jgi:hypothetical protein
MLCKKCKNDVSEIWFKIDKIKGMCKKCEKIEALKRPQRNQKV